MFGALHAQRPAVHWYPALHRTPHALQFVGSVWTLMQVTMPMMLHSRLGIAQSATHIPNAHVWPVAQAIPQAPQFIRSACGSMHAPLHARLGMRQLQEPAMHPTPDGQSVRQLPQFALSVCVFTQRPPHALSPAAQPVSGAASMGGIGTSPCASIPATSPPAGTSKGTMVLPHADTSAAPMRSNDTANERRGDGSQNLVITDSFDSDASEARRRVTTRAPARGADSWVR